MGRRSIVVATWGNPFEWGKAYYRLAESENKVESVTSLSLLMEELSPNLTVVLIPETLICVDAIKRYGGEVLSPKLSGKDEYRRLILGLRKSIEGFFKKNLPGKREVKVVVVPNVGEYGYEGVKFKWMLPRGGRISPDSAYASYVLISTILGIIEVSRRAEEVSIYLDTTHGINFMPLAAYRAVMAASRITSAFYGLKIGFEQYNSTPYPRGIRKEETGELPELEVFSVKKEIITPVKAAQRLVYSYLSREDLKPIRFARSLNKEEISEIKERLKVLEKIQEIHGRAKSVASSIHYSMPLAFLQFSKEVEIDVDGMENLIGEMEKHMGELLSYIDVKEEEGKLSIEHLVTQSYEDLKSLLSAFSLISYGRNCVKLLKNNIKIHEGLVEAPLNTLRKTVGYLQGPLTEVAENEISSFREKPSPEELRKMIETAEKNRKRWISPGEKGFQCEDVKRIMIAHAGLAFKSIEVMFNGSEIWLRYRRDCLERTREIIKKALEDTRKMVTGEEW
jgi:CRISPR-associated protein Csx1